MEVWPIGIIDYPFLYLPQLKCQGNQGNLSQQLYHFLSLYYITFHVIITKKLIVAIKSKVDDFIASCRWEWMCSNFSHKQKMMQFFK